MSLALESAIPVLRVADYARARDFWCGRLGFAVIEEGGDPARFGIIANGKAELHLDAWHGADPRREAGWRVYFHVPDADAVAAHLRSAEIEILEGPADTVYGMREVEIEDPDGNRLCFGQRVEG